MKGFAENRILLVARAKKSLLKALLFAVLVSTQTLWAGSTIYFVHNDHRGAPVMMTDMNAEKVWEANYKPFGEVEVKEDPDGDGKTVELNVRLPGQYYDKETGTNYNYYRDYDPRLGRYIQSDPIGLRGGLNTYAYANLSPMMNIDPYGLWSLTSTFSGSITPGKGKGGQVGTYYTSNSTTREAGILYSSSNDAGWDIGGDFGVDYYSGENTPTDATETNQLCFLGLCGRFHRDKDGNTIGYGGGIGGSVGPYPGSGFSNSQTDTTTFPIFSDNTLPIPLPSMSTPLLPDELKNEFCRQNPDATNCPKECSM